LFNDFRYRLDIPVVADYEMNFRAYRQGLPVLFLERQVAISGVHGISHTSSQFSSQVDAYRVRRRYLNDLSNALFLAMGLLNLLVESLVGRLSLQNRKHLRSSLKNSN
jgi:GT2 family glycosyltransferase